MSVVRQPLFAPTQVGNSAGSLYVSPTNIQTMITKLTFTNTDPAAHTISVYLGTAANDAHALRKTKTIPAAGVEGSAWECFEAEGHMLNPGDNIYAIADVASKVTAIGSGIQLTQG